MKVTRQLGPAFAIPFELAVAVLVGLGLGTWFDRRSGSAPWATVGGLALGLTAGLVSVLRALRAADSDPRPPDDPDGRPHGPTSD